MTERSYKIAENLLAWLCFAIALVTYLLTLAPSASFWDCPEYIAVAARLEVGHPPGNPFYMLIGRMVAMLAPDAAHIAMAVNAVSAIASAFTVWLLFKCIVLCSDVLEWRGITDKRRRVFTLSGATAGALIFAWSDTFWFSAVETEVYAMSVLWTALCFWLILKWRVTEDSGARDRILVLTAYLLGLSIGIHQLNLLCVPALVLVVMYRRWQKPNRMLFATAFVLSVIIVAGVLYGMMDGMPTIAKYVEVFCINTLGLPYHTGVILTVALPFVIGIATLCVIESRGPQRLVSVMLALLLFSTGFTSLLGHIIFGIGLALIVCGLLLIRPLSRRLARVAVLSLMMLMLGLSTYGIIYIRGIANPPMNEGNPSNIFSLYSYMKREQYGGAPLFYGRTPYSKIMREENLKMQGDSVISADYNRYYHDRGRLLVARRLDGSHGYDTIYTYPKYRYTPELDMWLPRIWSSHPDDIEAYKSWAGVDSTSMVEVEISEAIDSAGNPVGRYDLSRGERVKGKSLRPTYTQNLTYFIGYQTGYMYWRYLMWNFLGRQNDYHSQGQSDAGNFITGVDAIDKMMVGSQETMPRHLAKDNPGRNLYWGLPLLLGILGIVWQCRSGRRGRRDFLVVLMLFLMTGLAIVVYLNQTPGEARERDYSFVGSFLAYALWCGLGVAALGVWLRRWRGSLIVVPVIGIAVALLMLYENADDHSRRDMTLPSDLAAGMLEVLPQNTILFVDGDNYTFPLWYAIEVERVRPDVRVINLAYSLTDWYPAQLMTDTDGAPGVEMIASEREFSDRRFNYIYLPTFSTDTLPLADEVKRIYTMTRPGDRPMLGSAYLKVDTPDGDVVLDLYTAQSRSNLPQSQFMMLDILASAMNTGRPIAFMSVSKKDATMSLCDSTLDYGAVKLLKFNASETDHNRANDALYDYYMHQMRFGGIGKPGVYVDPVTGKMADVLRRQILQLADRLYKSGDYDRALDLLALVEHELPYDVIPANVITVNSQPYNSLIDANVMRAEIAEERGDVKMKREALQNIANEIDRLSQYAVHYSRLSGRERSVISTQFAYTAQKFPVLVERYLEVGGKLSDLSKQSVDRYNKQK